MYILEQNLNNIAFIYKCMYILEQNLTNNNAFIYVY
jgi:hypothetical protein